MEEKKPYKIDLPVLILFFNRAHTLKKVFAAVKEARPSKLYLYQDGPRADRPDDLVNIEACRKIVADIDWDCEVHQNYSEVNRGCDPSEYLAQKWMFATEEMGIVLEDDDVPSQSFFPYCLELLEKYKDDERINIICGMNNIGVSDYSPYDYLFTTAGSIWGWASWKRVIDMWEDHVSFIGDDFSEKQFCDVYERNYGVSKKIVKKRIKVFKEQKAEGRAYYESILGANAIMNNMLNIVPAKNMMSNVGFEGESTHNLANIKMLPKGIRRVFNMKTYEYDFPLKHPPFVIEDIEYKKKLDRIMANGHPFVKFYRKIESVILRIRYGGFKEFKKMLKKLFRIK